MSHGLTPFAVSLPQLQKVIGSRSKSVLLQLREEFEDELEADREELEEADDEFDPELTLDDALRHLIMDEERWDYEGTKYAHAIEMLCHFYGEFLPNEHWDDIDFNWVNTISDALKEAGVSVNVFSLGKQLLDRDLPIDIPTIETYPRVGYITRAEIPNVLELLGDQRLAEIKHRQADRIRSSLAQVREWLTTCQREKSDLVCFFDEIR